MLAPSTLAATPVWPIAGDVPDLQAIIWAQATTIADQADLIDAYQTVLENALAIANATAVANAATSGTSIVMTSVVGTIKIGAVVSGTGIPANTMVIAQTAGTTGTNGTYTVNNTVPILTNLAVTFSPGGGNPSWPLTTDPDELMQVVQSQTALLRNQTAMLQQYQDLLNVSQTPVPPTGP